MAEVIVRGDAGGVYFAYRRTPNRQIAPVADVERAARAIVHVHGGRCAPPPSIPPGLVTVFNDLDGELP